jgi:ribose transport system ATP-binding protein
MPTAEAAPRFEMRGIRKLFPGVVALDGVGFACRAGEIHALCGENGAGKSTLMKVLGGVYRADAGEILIDGRAVAFSHPVEARRAGISIIHQELSLLPDRTVAENIFTGAEPVSRGFLDRGAMRTGAAKLLARLQAGVAPDAMVRDLSIAEQQIVEIAKALAVDARILVMDEPTAALDDREAERLMALIRQLRGEGVAIVYISHRMPEVFALADTVTVLKDGRHVATRPRDELTPDEVVRLMVGRPLSDYFPPRPEIAAAAPTLLAVTGGGNDALADIDLTVRAGEIVCVGGLEGSGKSALARALIGADPFTRGRMIVGGRPLIPASPRQAIRAGLGYLPDDRKRDGLALQQSVFDNALLTLRGMARLLARPNGASVRPDAVDALLRAVDVRAAGWGQTMRQLSGGNQQKTIVARWLARDPRILIFAEPTRGIDVGSKAQIYRLMRDFVSVGEGRGIVVVSSDLQEVIGIADRIYVMHEGRIVAERPAGTGEEEIVALATGHAEGARRAA